MKNPSRPFSKLRSKLKGKNKESAALCILLGTGGGILFMFLLLWLFAAVLSAIALPLSVFKAAGFVVGAVSSGAAGFICSLLSRERGFFYGLACGALLFVILLLLSSLIWQQDLGTYSLIKFFTMLLCGAVGGSLGVNLS